MKQIEYRILKKQRLQSRRQTAQCPVLCIRCRAHVHWKPFSQALIAAPRCCPCRWFLATKMFASSAGTARMIRDVF